MTFKSIKEKLNRYKGERQSLGVDKKDFLGYKKSIDTKDYSIYAPPYLEKEVVAAYQTMVVKMNRDANELVVYPFYLDKKIRYRIKLSQKKFPGLISNSKIQLCLLVPYMREVSKNAFVKSIRLIIITDKCQIYHNYPSRGATVEGYSVAGDIVRFEESVVWDIPNRRYPSKQEKCMQTEVFYPNLPEECYKYRPMLNTDSSYKDTYGNGGFGGETIVTEHGKEEKVSRFYIHKRTSNCNPFFYMGRGDFDEKATLIGTYRNNVTDGVRTCVFATTDGGRQWFCKYEFADYGKYEFRQGEVDSWGRNFGNPIINKGYTLQDCDGMEIIRRDLVIPSEEEKEPKDLFSWNSVGQVQSLEKDEVLTLRLENKHGLTTGNVIALKGNNLESKLKWAFNDACSSNSAGNGILFKVEVVNDYSIRLYELVSNPFNNIPCRHIHHINRIKDGWIVGTGEIYPNGWLIYLQMKEADTFTPKKAQDEFPIIRLNSTCDSIQRTLGAILKDDTEKTLIYASDHDTLERTPFKITEDRDELLARSSTGVYKGSLKDIDDRNQYECVYEAKEPCFFFQQLDGMLIFGGQRGEFAISFDEGKSWRSEKLPVPVIRYRGSTGQYYYFDSCIIKRK